MTEIIKLPFVKSWEKQVKEHGDGTSHEQAFALIDVYGRYNAPSVSRVLSTIPDPDLDAWRLAVGEEKANFLMTAGANRGTALHKFFEQFFKAYKHGGDVEKSLLYSQKTAPLLLEKENISNEYILNGKRLFYQLYNETNLVQDVEKVYAIEQMIWSGQYIYVGKMDMLLFSKSRGRCIDDYKSSSKKIEKDSLKEHKYLMQLSAYWQLAEEFYNTTVDCARLWISINSGGTQLIELKPKEQRKYFAEFNKHCMEYHKLNLLNKKQ